tara:strand:+ start:2670 stop:3470 length:801 start_codon:yes stop_codon:yes gene_type:complete
MSDYTLGLDPSITSYGWCVYDPSQAGLDQVVERGRWKTSAKQLEVARYLSHRNNLTNLIQKYQIKRVGVETPPVGNTGGFAQERLYALYMYNMEVFYTQQVDVVLIAPTQLQLYAKVWGGSIVKGPWDKSDMVNQAQVHLLGLYRYPKHCDYDATSMTKRDRLRSAGYKSNRFPQVIVSEYELETRKKLRIQNDEADALHAARFSHRFFEFVEGRLSEEDMTPSEWDLFAKQHKITRGKRKGAVDKYGIIFKENERFYRFNTTPAT